MTDTLRHKGMRKRLIDSLQQKGITDEKVLQAMMNVPRHFFMPSGFDDRAYQDNAFPIASEQTISQPFTVGFQTMLLDVKRLDKVLEIGTGSGYQTAVLLELGAKVYTIERHKILHQSSQRLLNQLGYEPYCFFGDGYLGMPSYGPFDKIIITAGAPYIPEPLKQQLKIGGMIVIPVDGGKAQKMLVGIKVSETEFDYTDFGDFAFVPMLKGKV